MCDKAFTTVEFEANEAKLEAMIDLFKGLTQ